MKRAFSLIAGLAALVWPSPAEACSCVGSAPSSTAFRSADLVFVGTVTRVDGRKPQSRVNPDGSVSIGFGHEAPVTTFEIAKAFKGASARELTIAGDGTNCDIRFALGEAWLVYASSRDELVTTHTCTRTRLRAEAAEDLAYLEGREHGRRQGIVYGDVHRRIVAADGSPGLRALVEPLQVIAAGQGRRFTVTTDKWGPYQLVLPPGEFEIWVERGGRAVSRRQSVRLQHGSELRLMLVAEFAESAGAQEPARDTPALALERAEAQWRTHGPASYQYGIILTCFCAPKAMDFRVVGGQLQFPPSAAATTKQFHEEFGTIERLFARIRRAIGEGGHRVDVKYDAELGYPIWADLDPRREVKDDELFIRVTGFRAITATASGGGPRGGTHSWRRLSGRPEPRTAWSWLTSVAPRCARASFSRVLRAA